MSTDAPLRGIDETLRYLLAIATAQRGAVEPDLDRLLEGYLEARRLLARDFRALAAAMIPSATAELEGVESDISARMEQLFARAMIPTRLLTVRGYGRVHAELLGYLRRRVGVPVMASRLRVLVGDQIHTERRVREIRALGFGVSWGRIAGEDQYVLAAVDPDLDVGARRQLALNIRADRSISPEARASWLMLADEAPRDRVVKSRADGPIPGDNGVAWLMVADDAQSEEP